MSFTSKLYKNEVIIDDESDPYSHMVGEYGRGLDLTDRPLTDFAYSGFASPFDQSLIINPSEWQARIQEREEQQASLSNFIRYRKLDHKDQGSTNYCWINAPVHTLEIRRMQQNQRMVTLSPASAGAIIKNFRNVGGWGLEAIKFLNKYGCVPVEYWPANGIDSRFKTQANELRALDYRVREWIECQPRNVAQMVSLSLRNLPGAGGYNWWGHEITIIEPVWLDGEVAMRIRNSWKGWGDYGFGILRGRKMLADDIVFCVSGSTTQVS